MDALHVVMWSEERACSRFLGGSIFAKLVARGGYQRDKSVLSVHIQRLTVLLRPHSHNSERRQQRLYNDMPPSSLAGPRPVAAAGTSTLHDRGRMVNRLVMKTPIPPRTLSGGPRRIVDRKGLWW